MSAFALDALNRPDGRPSGRWRPALARWQALGGLTARLLSLLVGAELAVLVAWLPDTLASWWQGDRAGDFAVFYGVAQDLERSGLYSPFFPLILHPLTYLSLLNAYRAYAALGGLALLGVAYLAQRRAGSLEGRLAVALGVISLPQFHWALRIGHLTPILALAALAGFLLLRRRPVVAGLCFALLSMKPQYLLVPGLYLLWTRNGRALAALLVATAAMEVAGLAAVGFDALGPYLRGFLDWGGDARDNLLPAQQAWQYAWPGFLISAGLEPHPLLVFELVLLSLALVALVWARTDRQAAAIAAALGMLLVTPYSNFYDWGLLAVPGALLLGARLRWRWPVPLVLAGLYLAALASQAATPYPAPTDGLGGASTDGFYWITPAALAVVGLLLVAGRRNGRARLSATGRRRVS